MATRTREKCAWLPKVRISPEELARLREAYEAVRKSRDDRFTFSAWVRFALVEQARIDLE